MHVFNTGSTVTMVANVLLQHLKSSVLMRERAPSLQSYEIALGIITMCAYSVFKAGRALMNIGKKT